MKFAEFLRASILKSTYERLLLFIPPQDTIANSSGELGLHETWQSVEEVLLNKTILFDQMQPYHLYMS